MKRKRLVLTVAVFLLTCMAITVNAANVNINSVSAERGETVTFDVALSGSETVGGGSVSVSHYDSNVLELTGGTCNVSGAMLSTFDPKTGKGGFFFNGTSAVSGSLFTVTFKVKEDAPYGTTAVSMDVTLQDGNKQNISVQINNGSITVKDNTPAIPSVGETVTGYNLTLQGESTDTGSGDIGVNLKFVANETLRNDGGAYVSVIYNGTETKHYLNALSYDSNGKTEVTVNVPAKEMANDITATVYNGAGECGASYTYSVKSYAEYILEHSSEYDAKLVSMVKATLNYGAYAQKYFGYKTEALANSSLSEADKAAVEAVTSIDVTDASMGKAESVGIAKHSASIVLGSETTIKHYITLEEGQNINSYIFQVNSTSATPILDGDRYCITISNIAAYDLDGTYSLQVIRMAPFGMYTATFNVMNYVEGMFNSVKNDAAQTDLCNLMKAMYLYSSAANTYFGK